MYKTFFMLFIFALSVWLGIFFNKNGIYETIHQFVFFRIDHAFVALSFMVAGFAIRNDMWEYIHGIDLGKKHIATIVFLGGGREHSLHSDDGLYKFV